MRVPVNPTASVFPIETTDQLRNNSNQLQAVLKDRREKVFVRYTPDDTFTSLGIPLHFDPPKGPDLMPLLDVKARSNQLLMFCSYANLRHEHQHFFIVTSRNHQGGRHQMNRILKQG
uniref:(northern house mosquito) hypothetical protein n=1 Tax=Culex pipiens TaxID=7175 RepID=A0A8D8F7L0_CULPI